ncbi:SPFH domain-containing protein [Thalassobaculum sp.]|jgi:regulator of protease activity HflC (stomatin/prohibitin superfamily)|uniref:SPFH domain-containing protein n=1 Tax=Thalassobaculum sp. TaxID=2022740 RepID=UPI003B5CDC50
MDPVMDFISGGQIALIVLAIVLIFLVVKGVRIVPQGEQWTVERFGRYVTTLDPGLGVINPLFSRIGKKVNMMENVLDIPEQDVITQDNASCRVDAIVFYQVIDARRAAYEVRDLEGAVINLALTNIRSVLGSTDLDAALSSRDEMNSRILKVMDEATDPWGTKITRVEIKDISPPKDLLDAMASQMKAEREKRAQILEAEGYRAAAVQRAEGDKQSEILKAEGELVAAQRQAEARERLAQAEAEATRLVAEAIGSTGTNAVNYFVAQKYVEALSDFAKSPNQKTIFMPMEVSSIVGSIGGIKELLNAVPGGSDLPPPPPPRRS